VDQAHWHPLWLERRDLAGVELARLKRRLRSVSVARVRRWYGRAASSPGEARICRPNLPARELTRVLDALWAHSMSISLPPIRRLNRTGKPHIKERSS